ncbi:VOC family protein [Nocardioides sp. BGMRC 2183]|nr:VOC family protein [Nocardioides sp. BGMRC 2183]
MTTDTPSSPASSSPAPINKFLAFCIDTPDAARAARFYAALTGGEASEFPEYRYAAVEALGTSLNFQTVADYRRPEWPGQEHPQQFHLDFGVPALEPAIAHAQALGATVAAEQPDGATWRVMIDPDGHPFCLCPPHQ